MPQQDPNRSHQSSINGTFFFRSAITVASVFVCSYLAARLGDLLVLRPQMIWPLWPGSAFVVSALLLTRSKILWPALLLSGLAGFALYDIQIGLNIRSTVLFLLADAVEILVAASGMRLALSGLPRINSVASLAQYSFFVILAPILVTPFVARFLGGVYRATWPISFLSDALALLTLTPAIMSWARIALAREKKPFAQYFEATLMFLGLLILSYLAFASSSVGFRPVRLYALVPLLLWSALRFGVTGISNSLVVVAFFSIWGSTHGRGPFIGDSPLANVLSLQFFLLFAAASFMVLAALVEEKKSDEQQLRESEQRFRLVADTAPALIWMAGPDKLCTYVNHSWLDFTGRSLKQELGNGWTEVVHPDDLQDCLSAYTRSFDRRERFAMEYRVRRHDSEYRWIMDTGVPRFNQEGSLAGYIGIAIDVTERKKAEEAMLGINRRLIEAQERERSRIGRELHDDINQRLALLAMELENLRENPSRVRKRAQELWQGIHEIAADVQALSHELHSTKLEYLGVVAGMRSWCKEFADRQNLEIDFVADVSNTLPSEIGLTLFRILQEALHNAVKHSGVKRMEVQLSEQANKIHLIIRDSGKGFDLQTALHGKGLGLTSMTERARLVNGNIAIDSRPMGGTTIHISAPLASEQQDQQKAI
jgi:PAS domain S-box-containing protein